MVETKVKVFDPAMEKWQAERHAAHAATVDAPRSPRSLLGQLKKLSTSSSPSCPECEKEKEGPLTWAYLGGEDGFHMPDPWSWEFGRTANRFTGTSKNSDPHWDHVREVILAQTSKAEQLMAEWNAVLRAKGVNLRYHEPNALGQGEFLEIQMDRSNSGNVLGGPTPTAPPMEQNAEPSAPAAPLSSSSIKPFCGKCGAKNTEMDPFCSSCGADCRKH